MRRNRTLRSRGAERGLLAAALLVGLTTSAWAQGPSQPPKPPQTTAPLPNPWIEVYGFGQADAIAQFKQSDPNWYDVNRPTKLPSFADQFGQDGRFYLSPRQSRLGAKGETYTSMGTVKAQFEFDMFGVGRDAGLTTIRLRHAWGQFGQVGAGQTNSQFMDVDVFPNILEYWGPNGMLFFRNVQVFWRPVDDEWRATLAIEAPGASGDAGVYNDRIEIQGISPRFPVPDITGEVRWKRDWGYIRGSGIYRRIDYDDTLVDAFDLSGHVNGWGFSASSNINAGKRNVFRLQYIYGEAIQNYFNDAPVDIGIQNNFSNPVTPIIGVGLPIQGISAYLDHNWSDTLSSAFGYARVDIDNSDGQLPSAFKAGQYASFNVLTTPVKNVMIGSEFQWAHRENNSDGFKVSDYRLQVSFKYSFGYKIGG